MKKLMLVALAVTVAIGASHLPIAAQNSNLGAWEKQAQNVTIIRDNWGIAHVYGKTDADAVFGVVYAQAEDDFNRVETNFINGLGRLAEAEGEKEIYRDLRQKLYEDPDDLKAKYQASPAWLKTLMNAWADGLNYYLATHPKVTPRVIRQFEPWMALSFSEGSIGGDIERINLQQLEAFYGGKKAETQAAELPFEQRQYEEPTGSNGAAIAPSNTVNRHSLLLINPHTSFFFRSEAQMVSEEGLNAYGAITWGQFFIYQGFNDRAGWMHTSSGVDNIDEYLETVTKKGDGYLYKYGGDDRPVTAKKIVVPYKTASGMAKKEFTVYRTHHGPVVRELDGKWVSVRMMQDELKALTQSYSRTKAKSYKAYRDSMELHTNSSNNTIYADADGNIAYFHSNFIPRRNPTYDWTRPVDGSTRATEWDNILSIDETPGLLNPKNGWLYNVNNWPWSAAGPDNSPKRNDYPAYVDRGTSESPRGVHAQRVLSNKKDFTLDGLIAAAYDSYLPSFAVLVPPLLKAWDAAPDTSPLKSKLQEPIAMLRAWDYRWSATSVPTSLGQYYGEEIGRRVGGGGRGGGGGTPNDETVAQRATPDQMLQALSAACDRLTADFGTWRTPWGDINRYQRNNGDITQVFDDKKPSIPVAFTSSRWGSLASFGARTYPGTKKMYGTSGNSFVAVVEFGDRVKAKAVSAGGEGGDPASPHFADQAVRYAQGDLRDVYFYREDVEKHAQRTYHPGK
jgi:acyl-homoserine lactone acylase PvdQ